MYTLKIAENKIVEKYYKNIKVGDLIVYSGKTIMDKVVQWDTNSHYSHVSIVCDVDHSPRSTPRVLIIEISMSTKLNNVHGKKAIRGVQLHSLSEWIDAYKDQGEIWWLPLSTKLSAEGQARMQAWLKDVFKRQVPYSVSKTILAGLNQKLGLKFQPAINLFGLFCSELVTKALQLAGAVDPFIHPSQQSPKDVVNFPCFAGQALKSLI